MNEHGPFYKTLGRALREEFGEPIRKVSIDAGLECPHRSFEKGKSGGGCIFCDPASFSPARRSEMKSIAEQIDEGIRRIRLRHDIKRFIAYFQPSTNTNAPVGVLEPLFRQAMEHPSVAAIAVGTRPDCLPEEVLDLLASLAERKPLFLEIGLQTIHDRLLRFLNRGHDYAAFLDAYRRARRRNLRIGIHLILGIPGETEQERIACAEEIARLSPYAVKLHNLYVAKNTPLARMWERGEIPLPSFEEYARGVVDFLERQSPDTIVERIASDVSSEFLLAPDWTAQKNVAKNAVDREFRRRATFQSCRYSPE